MRTACARSASSVSDETALAAGDVLALLEAERAVVADRADQALRRGRQVGLGGVLDHRHARSGGDGRDAGEIGGVAEQVRDDDRPGAVGEHRGHRLGGHVAGHRIGVGEDRDGALVDDGRQARPCR